VGEPVAVVAADTLEIADEAIDLIKIEYEQRPAVFRADEALAEGAPLLYERFPGHYRSWMPLFPAGWSVVAGQKRRGWQGN